MVDEKVDLTLTPIRERKTMQGSLRKLCRLQRQIC